MSIFPWIFCLLLPLFFVHGSSPDKFSSFEYNQRLSPKVELFWSINDDRGDLTIGLKYLDAPGWVGFGISVSGGMKGADIALLNLNSTGQLVLQDMFSDQYAQPQPDEFQNKYLMWAYQDSKTSYTELIFSRPLAGCGSEDITINVDFPSHIIFAYGADHTFQYHGANSRGIADVVWIPRTTPTQDPSIDANSQTISLRAPNLTIPARLTTYLCTYFSLPITGKHHVSKIIPIATSPLVHHIVIYKCDREVNQTVGYRCNMADCFTFWAVWAVGANPLQIPDDVGLPIGDGPECEATGCSRFFRLEVHYNNPLSIANTVDSSGFELTLSPTLRKYDMGTIAIGVDFTHLSIPPQTPHYSVTNVCPSTCLSKYIPEEGVSVLVNQFHMHQVGTSIWTQQIRGNEEQPPLGNMTHWDFSFQSPQPSAATIFPNDTLITTCVYNSLGIDTVTRGGEASYNEMCFNFVNYYPKVPLAFCFDIAYYSTRYAACVNESGTGFRYWDPEWIKDNIVPMSPLNYVPYSPPTPCACNSSCWVPPTQPNYDETSGSGHLAFMLSLNLLILCFGLISLET